MKQPMSLRKRTVLQDVLLVLFSAVTLFSALLTVLSLIPEPAGLSVRERGHGLLGACEHGGGTLSGRVARETAQYVRPFRAGRTRDRDCGRKERGLRWR